MWPAIDTAFLRGSDLFENQPEEVLKAVLVQGQLQHYGPGQVVFSQGQEGDRLYINQERRPRGPGQPSDAAEPIPVAYLGPGEVLGELALLTGSPRSASAACRSRPSCSPSTSRSSST
jgi:CRP/FNR family transcriptional regulator